MSHSLETNISQNMVRTIIHTVDFNVWVNKANWQGWTDNHDDWGWQRDR